MNDFRILLLGPPVFYSGEQLYAISRRIPRAVLIYLAVAREMVSRDELLGLFWDGAPLEEGRQRLRETLSRLRNALPSQSILISYDNQIGLNPDCCFIDVHRFLELTAQMDGVAWKSEAERPLHANAYQPLVEAVQLWRTPRFVDGSNLPSSTQFDYWLAHTSSRLERTRSAALKQLAEHAYASGDVLAAYQFTLRSLEDDYFNEALQLKALEYLHELGRIAEAYQRYQVVVEQLKQNSQTSLSPELIRFGERLKKTATIRVPHVRPEWSLHPDIEIPFVGRQAAMEQIQAAVANHKGVFILGESGVGKTRLVQEFTRRAGTSRQLLVTTCRPILTSLAYHPIAEVFRKFGTPEKWQALSPVWISRLTRLLPELAERFPALPAPENPAETNLAQSGLLEAIGQMFDLMAQIKPLILFIDDAQWADEATLTTVAYLMSRPTFQRLASLILTIRQEELSPSLERTLLGLQRSHPAVTIRLTQLDEEEINVLAQTILQRAAPPAFVQKLASETGGNPFMLIEVLRNFAQQDLIPELVEGMRLPLTEDLQALIQSRLHRLTAEARAALEVAAVIGTDFTGKILTKASQKPDDEIIGALEELERHALITSIQQPTGRHSYQFVHDKFREGVLNQLAEARLQMLHQRVAGAILEAEGTAQAAILAEHFGAAQEFSEALQYWVMAGLQARQLFSIQDAMRAYSRAENLLEILPNKEAHLRTIYQLYAQWGEMAYEINDVPLTRRLGQALIDLGEQFNDRELIGAGWDVLSDACMMVNDFALGLEYTNRALAYLSKTDNIYERIETHNHRGVFLYMVNRLDEAIVAFEESLALSRDQSEETVTAGRSNAHYQIALIKTLKGWPEIGCQHALLGYQEARQARRPYSIIQSLSQLALSRYYLGDYVQALQDARESIALGRRSQGWRMVGYSMCYAAWAALALGQSDEAWNYGIEAIELGRTYQHQDVIALGQRALGDIFFMLQTFDLALEHYQYGVNAIGEHFIGMDNLARLGLMQTLIGNVEQGQELMALALSAMQHYSIDLGVWMVKTCQCLHAAWDTDGNYDEFCAPDFQDELAKRGLAAMEISILNLQWKSPNAAAHNTLALSYLKHAASQARKLHNPWLELDALQEIKIILAISGQKEHSYELRTSELLSQLSGTHHRPEIADHFQNFWEKIMRQEKLLLATL